MTLRAPRLDEIHTARDRIADAAIRTPLLPLDGTGRSGGVWLKLECLQPIGSFKIRGAANAIAAASPDEVARGVYTASAGNMAQGVAFAARRLGLPCRVIVPDSAPRTKCRAVERLGGTVVPLPYDEWWRVIVEHGHPDEDGFFVHPVSDPAVIAGNATTGLEIMEELPNVDDIVVPWGGGGLSCGIASAVRAVAPGVRIHAAEVETAAPLAASLAAGRPRTIERTPSFVDGIGGSSLLTEMWPLARDLLTDSLVVSIEAVCDAIRLLVDRPHIVAEGAGASSVAAALAHLPDDRRIVAVVSGGNIDTSVLRTILTGGIPH